MSEGEGVRLAIAGAALSDDGAVGEGWTPADLMVQGTHRALAQAGIGLDEVDGLFAAGTQMPMASLSLGEALGLPAEQVTYTDSTQIGGSSPIAHLQHARAAIGAGECSVAVIAYGSTQRSAGGRAKASVQEISPWEAPYRPMNPVTAYALAASRHMHKFGTTPEQLAEVAVAARGWAQRNPAAWSREELTVADVLAAPRVCDPLGVRDCCLVTDGGGALVVCSAERAASIDGAVAVLGIGTAHSHRHISAMRSLTTTSAAVSGPRAFAEAGLTPGDVDSLQLYDAFTITPILFLEDLGFCPKGDGGPFVEGGRIGPEGALPVNTNGGGLSYGHPGMYGMTLLVEAVRRLRDTDDHVALAHGNGGVLSSQCTVLLGDERTR